MNAISHLMTCSHVGVIGTNCDLLLGFGIARHFLLIAYLLLVC